MAVTLQTSGDALFPSSKMNVRTVSAAYNNATAISKGSTKSVTASQDRLEISRGAKQLFAAKQNTSNSWVDTVRSWLQQPVEWLKKAGSFALEAAEAGLNFLVLDDIRTLFNPNASKTDKIISLVSLFPAGKVTKAGKLYALLKKYGKGEMVDALSKMGNVLKYNSKAVLMEGNSKEGWKHIVENHIIGKPGKSLFPKHMEEAQIKNLIMECVEKGSVFKKQRDGAIVYLYRPNKYGISEMLTVVDSNGIIRTSFPTNGTSVFRKE